MKPTPPPKIPSSAKPPRLLEGPSLGVRILPQPQKAHKPFGANMHQCGEPGRGTSSVRCLQQAVGLNSDLLQEN